MRPVIEVDRVFKSYRMQGLKPRTLKEAALGLFRPSTAQVYEALKDVSFSVHAGETVGIIGSNGSGKSTMLKLITGIIRPTSGRVTIDGRISPLLELGAGFHPDFTGRENVFLNGSILGLKRQEVEAMFDDIVTFSEIGDFINQPVKTYSSGMYMRLAFSIAVHVEPDILLVDEVLAVGDMAFQRKCLGRILQFRDAGKTILFVSHDHHAMAKISDRVIWLDRGVKRMDGNADDVLGAYQANQAGGVTVS